jgi:hypothetical protein
MFVHIILTQQVRDTTSENKSTENNHARMFASACLLALDISFRDTDLQLWCRVCRQDWKDKGAKDQWAPSASSTNLGTLHMNGGEWWQRERPTSTSPMVTKGMAAILAAIVPWKHQRFWGLSPAGAAALRGRRWGTRRFGLRRGYDRRTGCCGGRGGAALRSPCPLPACSCVRWARLDSDAAGITGLNVWALLGSLN